MQLGEKSIGLGFQEFLLKSLARPVAGPDCSSESYEVTVENALDLLKAEYRDFGRIVSGKRIVDFGCGEGQQSIGLVKQFGCSVVGVDTNHKILQTAVANAALHGVPQNSISFVSEVAPDMLGTFDVVVSQNSYEHFGDPEGVLQDMQRLISPTGRILISFGPPWFAPYGSHMHFFCKVPWLNILFSEKAVMAVRSDYRADGARKYEEVESGLNKMTVARFEKIVASCGMRIEFKNYRCIRKLNLLARIPWLRELFINHISVILRPAVAE